MVRVVEVPISVEIAVETTVEISILDGVVVKFLCRSLSKVKPMSRSWRTS